MSKFLQAGVSRRGVTVAGAKDVAIANPIRRGLTIQNKSDTEMHVTETNEDASSTVGFVLAPGAIVEVATNMRVSLWCSVAGKAYEATEA